MDEETYLKARRLNLECSIAMVYADGFRVVSNCRNISETGAYVHTREPPQEGTTITYSFYLGMIAEPFQGRALVRWVRPLPQPRGGETNGQAKQDKAAHHHGGAIPEVEKAHRIDVGVERQALGATGWSTRCEHLHQVKDAEGLSQTKKHSNQDLHN